MNKNSTGDPYYERAASYTNKVYQEVGNTSTEPQRNSKMEDAILGLEKEICALDEGISSLRRRLSPMLSPDRPAIEPTNREIVEIEPSPLVIILRRLRGQIIDLQLLVGNITERLDL